MSCGLDPSHRPFHFLRGFFARCGSFAAKRLPCFFKRSLRPRHIDVGSTFGCIRQDRHTIWSDFGKSTAHGYVMPLVVRVHELDQTCTECEDGGFMTSENTKVASSPWGHDRLHGFVHHGTIRSNNSELEGLCHGANSLPSRRWAVQ